MRLTKGIGLLVVVLGAVGLAAPARADGITAWGYDSYGEVSNAPTGTGYTAIAGGYLQRVRPGRRRQHPRVGL